jgi:hypothetical protein
MGDYPFNNNPVVALNLFIGIFTNFDFGHEDFIIEYPNLYKYLTYDAQSQSRCENIIEYQESYESYFGNTEQNNSLKTMCYIDSLDLNMEWYIYFLEGNSTENLRGIELFFTRNFPIYMFNYIKLLNFHQNQLMEFIDYYAGAFRSLQFIKTTRYINKIFLGVVRSNIDTGGIINLDTIFTTTMDRVYIKYRSMVIDYLIDNQHIDVNIESRYNDLLDVFNTTLQDQYRGLLDNTSLYSVSSIISQLAIPTRNQRLRGLLNLYAENYGGWGSISAVINNTNLLNPYIIFLGTFKYYCKYLRNTFPNPNDVSRV